MTLTQIRVLKMKVRWWRIVGSRALNFMDSWLRQKNHQIKCLNRLVWWPRRKLKYRISINNKSKTRFWKIKLFHNNCKAYSKKRKTDTKMATMQSLMRRQLLNCMKIKLIKTINLTWGVGRLEPSKFRIKNKYGMIRNNLRRISSLILINQKHKSRKKIKIKALLVIRWKQLIP